jgi:two-component system, response regulator
MIVLYAEDNPGDQLLAQEALRESGVTIDLRLVNDGRELLLYLSQCERRSHESMPRPHIILLDLNMPGKSGLEALVEIKSNPFLWDIPVIVLTSSNAETDIARSYEAGATAYVRKPTSYPRLVRMMGALGKFWDKAKTNRPEDEDLPDYAVTAMSGGKRDDES